MILSQNQMKLIYKNALYTPDKKTGYFWNITDFSKVKNLHKDFILLTASCGRGKTTFALDLSENGLLAKINEIIMRTNLFTGEKIIEPDEIVFLTSRKSIKDQQRESNKKICYIPSEKDFQQTLDFFHSEATKGKIKIMTAHSFGRMIKNNQIEVFPRLIIIDELHSIFAETAFAEDLWFVIDYLKNTDAVKVGMTATPEFLYNYIADLGSFNFVCVDVANLGSRYHAKEVIALLNGTANTLIDSLSISQDNKTLVYIQSATQCYNLSKRLNEKGINSAFIVSQYNDKVIDGKPLNQQMRDQVYSDLDICRYITKFEKFPDEVNVLIINDASREGINIKDENVKCIVCESIDMTTIKQILGRIRQDIDTFYVVCNFQNETKVQKTVNNWICFLKDYEERERDALLSRYERQKILKEQNRNIEVFVIKKDENYVINEYAKMTTLSLVDSYAQMRNYKETNVLISRDGKPMKTQTLYLQQLGEYSDTETVDIKMFWDEIERLEKSRSKEKIEDVITPYLRKPLDKAMKEQLCADLALWRVKAGKERKEAKWTTIKKELIDHGYSIKDKQIGKERKRVSIIDIKE